MTVRSVKICMMTETAEKSVRQRKRRKEARPGEIIAAGLLEFADNGYAATRLSDVAKRAGVAKGTIYRYFADKEALFLAAMRSHATPTFEHLYRFIDVYEGTTRDLLTSLIQIVHQKLVQGDLQVLMRIIITEGRNFPQLTELYYNEGVSHGQKILDRVVQRGIALGEIRPGPAAQLPVVIMAPAIMATLWKFTFSAHHPIEAEQFLAAHIDLVLNGMLVDGPSTET